MRISETNRSRTATVDTMVEQASSSTFRGSCHCGRVVFEVDARPTSLSQCNCSLCHKKGAIYVKLPEIDTVRVIAGESDLQTYQFNTKQAKHYFCKNCGIHVFHRPRLDPSRWSVNARCLEDFDISEYEITQFDGQNWEATAKKLGFLP
jgi:hypothetical protein